MAWSLEGADFVLKVGPIALIQQPTAPDSLAPAPAPVDPETAPLPTLNSETAKPLVRFGDLLVVTFADPSPGGAVQFEIGRDPENDLVVQDPSVSGRHASIQWDGQRGIIVELGSVNGTFINLQKIWARAALTTGDRLSFGRSTFVYLLAADFRKQLRRWSPKPASP